MSSLNESTAAIAETKTPCTHGRVFEGVCVYCKALVKSSPGYFRLPGGHFITVEEHDKIRRVKCKQLIRDRKLTLLLDLDQTVIDTSEADHGCKSAEVLQLPSGKKMFLLKRPYLDEFLQRVSKFFEIHVVTNGSEMYTRKVVDIIDPTKLISRNILSKEKIIESENGKKFPVPEMGLQRLCVIVDDKPEAWFDGFQRNVLQVRPFTPFAKMNHGIPYKSAVLDLLLLTFAGKLESIRSEFFKQYDINKKTRVEPIINQYSAPLNPLKAALEFSERVNQVPALKYRIANLEIGVASLEAEVKKIQESTSKTDIRLGTVEERISTIEATVRGLVESITGLSVRMGSTPTADSTPVSTSVPAPVHGPVDNTKN